MPRYDYPHGTALRVPCGQILGVGYRNMWSTIEPHQLGQWGAMKLTEQLLADLDYLEKIGMTVDQLRSLPIIGPIVRKRPPE